MKRCLILGVLLGVILSAPSPPAHADSYYRINMRAYRRMMHFQGPHPLADRFLGFVDNQLQPGGTLEQLFKAILDKNLPGASQQNQVSDTLIAQTPASPDPFLTAADVTVRAMCAKRGITYIEIPQAPTQTPQAPLNPSGLTLLDLNFSQPAPVPTTGFTNPPDL